MKEREKQLQEEIERLQAQLKVLKTIRKIDWSKYTDFNNGKYLNCPGNTLVSIVGSYVRPLASVLFALYEKEHGYNDYITGEKTSSYALYHSDIPSVRNLTNEQAQYINAFLDECYPIIEKYALISLERNKGTGNER